jgi:predicted Zn-dependent protease
VIQRRARQPAPTLAAGGCRGPVITSSARASQAAWRVLQLVVVCALSGVVSLGAQPSAEPGPLAAPFEEAYRRFVGGDAAGAVAILKPHRAQVAQRPQVAVLLGAAYLDLGRAADAAALLDPLAAQPGAGPAVLLNAARAAIALGQEARGDELLERAAAKAPASQASRALGLRRGRQGRFADAHRLLGQWLAEHPQDVEARLALAFASLETGRAAEVEGLLRDLPPDEPEVRLLAARALLAGGQPQEAIARLEPLAADPPAPLARDLRWTLAEAMLRVGRAADAARLLAGGTGDDPALTLKLLQAYQQSGEPTQVLAASAPLVDRLAVADTLPPAERATWAAIAVERGRALLAGRSWGEAVDALQRATALDPGLAVAWQLLAQALRGAGRTADADAALARFQQLSRPAG